MRIAHLMLASLLAATLVACNEDNSTENGGSGGTGGEGGTGGSGGETFDCNGASVLELASTTNATLNGQTDTRDRFVGSCTPPGDDGNDVVVHYKIPEDGHYRFSTAGTDFDTVIYALTDCIDGFTELKCNDDADGYQSAFTLLDQRAGADVFVIVDSIDLRQSRPFTLTAEKITSTVPVIDEYAAYYNSGAGTTALRASGRNPDSPLVAYSFQLYAPDGTAMLPEPFVNQFGEEPELLRVVQESGTFEVIGSFSLTNNPTIGAIELILVDALDLPTAAVKENAEFPPSVGRGESCDPSGGLSVCQGSDVCTGTPPVCTAAP